MKRHQKRMSLICAVICVLSISVWTSLAEAHRVSLFAWVENGQVLVQGKFSTSTPARFSRVLVLHPETKHLLLEGRTDDRGMWSFPVPTGADQSGLLLRIDAGEGHQNTWSMDPSEFPRTTSEQSVRTVNGPAAAPETRNGSRGPVSQEPVSQTDMHSDSAASADHEQMNGRDAVTQSSAGKTPGREELSMLRDMLRDEIRTEMRAELETALAPIRRTLALGQEQGIRLTDVLGGIGWILGLCGIACFFLQKNRTSSCSHRSAPE